MSAKELEEYINKIEPNFNSHLEKGTIEMSNEYYNLLEEKMVRLINKNQELKKQLDYLRRSIERKEQTIIDLQNERVPYTNKYVYKLENHQKKFINYLTSYIELLSNKPDLVEEGQKEILEEILLKYKKIIGGKNDK